MYIEPVYMNEKMVLNCAAYLFKGVALETETSEGQSSKNKGNLSLGFKYLQELLSPISAGAEQQKEKTQTTKTARRYTMGGLHMALIDALRDAKEIHHLDLKRDLETHGNFVELNVILRPVEFHSLVETLRISTPLIGQLLQNFGDKFNAKVFNPKFNKELTKYEELLNKILGELEEDYLKSGQLEMIMIDPKTGAQIGIADIDVSELEAVAVKAKLTDGQFKVIGKISRTIPHGAEMSLVQRSVLSSILQIVEKIAAVGGSISQYHSGMNAAKMIAQEFCQLSLPGPAVRVVAMSVCI
jgi:hypothetical protein